MTFDLARRLSAEALGTFFLVMGVIGSGIMAETLAGGNVALALLCNTVATAAILVVIITIFFPVSGAQFNPAVTFAMLLKGEIGSGTAVLYVAAQIVGGCVAAVIAHLMFGLAPLQISETARNGFGQLLGEFIATFGLIATILGCLRFRPAALAAAVGLYIGSAYWFTASTSFANPAVTIARSLTNTFSGIAPADAPGFVAAELLGALAAVYLFGWLFAEQVTEAKVSRGSREPRAGRRPRRQARVTRPD
jgi:glycerol uptake facilitator-like aquaporin